MIQVDSIGSATPNKAVPVSDWYDDILARGESVGKDIIDNGVKQGTGYINNEIKKITGGGSQNRPDPLPTQKSYADMQKSVNTNTPVQTVATSPKPQSGNKVVDMAKNLNPMVAGGIGLVVAKVMGLDWAKAGMVGAGIGGGKYLIDKKT